MKLRMPTSSILAAIISISAANYSIQSVHAHGHNGHDGCGTHDSTPEQDERSRLNEVEMYGKSIADMSRKEISTIHSSTVAIAKGKGNDVVPPPFQLRRDLQTTPVGYSLVGVPIVWHILTNQGSGRVDASDLQIDYAMNITNKLYNIYDKATGQSVQWASFTKDSVIRHTNGYRGIDCSSSSIDFRSLVESVDNWQYKFHSFICESTQWSGVASFPNNYAPTEWRHNFFRNEFRATSCWDDGGNDLGCPENGKLTRWWRTKSGVFAHE